MTHEEQDKLWNDLSEEKKKEYRKEFQEESESHHQNVKYCDRKNEFEYNTGYSDGFVSTLKELFGKHNLQPTLTYEDVARELFGENNEKQFSSFCCPVFSKSHCDKISAINALICVAKFLNKNEDGSDWVPDFYDEDSEFYTFGIDPTDNSIRFIQVNIERVPTEIVYFRTRESMSQAVQILGEDCIRTALTIEY